MYTYIVQNLPYFSRTRYSCNIFIKFRSVLEHVILTDWKKYILNKFLIYYTKKYLYQQNVNEY